MLTAPGLNLASVVRGLVLVNASTFTASITTANGSSDYIPLKEMVLLG